MQPLTWRRGKLMTGFKSALNATQLTGDCSDLNHSVIVFHVRWSPVWNRPWSTRPATDRVLHTDPNHGRATPGDTHGLAGRWALDAGRRTLDAVVVSGRRQPDQHRSCLGWTAPTSCDWRTTGAGRPPELRPASFLWCFGGQLSIQTNATGAKHGNRTT